MQFNLKINGTDFSRAFNSIGYGVSYLKIEGDNGGTTLDGTLVEDVLAWKAVVNLPCIDLDEDMLSRLLTACMADSLSVEYYDLKTKKIRRPSPPSLPVRCARPNPVRHSTSWS